MFWSYLKISGKRVSGVCICTDATDGNSVPMIGQDLHILLAELQGETDL